MVASGIAYFLTALFAAVGLRGFYRIGRDLIPASEENRLCFLSIAYLGLAWGCAYLGGI